MGQRGRRKGSGARAGADAHPGLRVVQALADPSRWRAVELLEPADRSIGDLAQALGLSLPCTSHHVSILKEVGVVSVRRVGKASQCRLAAPGSTIGDMVRLVRRMGPNIAYVWNERPASAGGEPDRHRPSAGAIPEFEPSRR